MKAKRSLSDYWRDIVHQASGNSAAQAIGLLGIPVLSRIYSPEDFAVQNIFLQISMFFAGIMTWRYEFFFQLLAGARQSQLLFLWIVKLGVISGVALTLILYFFGRDLSLFFGAPALSPYLVFAPITAFLISLGLALQHNVQRSGRFKISAASEVAGKFSYVLVGVLLAPLGAVGLIFTNLFSALGKIFFLWRELFSLLVGYSHREDIEAHPKVAHFRGASSMVSSHVFLTVGSTLPILFISYRYGIETLGQFSMVMSTIFLPSGLIGLAIGQVFYQRAAQYFRDSNDIKSLWISTVLRLVAFGVPIYMVAVICSDFIYPLVLGKQWEVAGHYAQVFSVAAFFAFISTPLDRITLILRINTYLPIMHFFRMLAAVAVVAVAQIYKLEFSSYLILLTFQMSLLYSLDMVFGYFFLDRDARRRRLLEKS